MIKYLFLLFTPKNWGRWNQFDEYVSFGLKPPARYISICICAHISTHWKYSICDVISIACSFCKIITYAYNDAEYICTVSCQNWKSKKMIIIIEYECDDKKGLMMMMMMMMMIMITTLILCDWMKWFIFDAPVKWSFMIVVDMRAQGITATKTCIWATSQACPLRRSHLDDLYGNMVLGRVTKTSNLG